MKQKETNIKAAFYIPFGYLYGVRLRSIAKLLSWLLLYILPTAFYAAVGYSGSWALFALHYVLVLLATFTLYELGYIFNDTYAIRRENAPSLRLNEDELRYFFAHQWTIIATRVLIAMLCLGVLSFWLPILPVSLAILTMCILFAIYNRWRNNYNVFLYIWLVFSRYLPFMMLCEHGVQDYLFLFLSYPLLIGIERFSMPRYRWRVMRRIIPTEEAKTRFRVWYYTLLLCIATPLMILFDQDICLLIPIFILWIYRLVRYFLKRFML